ncbi:hypothetical protein GCM10023088_78790 [Actinomadura verrucosospora]|uniref:hypothetical protein n=1 Tax=Actinomadura TaxID=1988 RepID=UPI0031E87C9C
MVRAPDAGRPASLRGPLSVPFGSLVVALGHVGGLSIPDTWTRAPGVTGECRLPDRPSIVYRSRDEQLGMHRPRRGWKRAA